MSIIYEALRKTEQHLDQKHLPRSARSIRWFDVVLLITIGRLLSLVVVSYYPKIQAYFSSKSVPVPVKVTVTPKVISPVLTSQRQVSTANQAQAELEYKGNLVLNGIFISDQESIALINNQSYHVGDSVDGKKIVSIQQNKIKLKDGEQILVWRTLT